jgi:polysaccharide pyruvyl transferase WcaK-like protein
VTTPALAESKAAPRIALWGHFGALNFGNECTLGALIHNLRVRLPNAHLSCICSFPKDTAIRHRLHTVALRNRGDGIAAPNLPRVLRKLWWAWVELRAWWTAWREAGKYDALIVAGTGILTDNGEGALGLPYELFKWTVVSRLRGRKVIFLSVGTEALASPAARFFVKHAVRLAHFCSFRDEHSKSRIVAIGAGTGGFVYPDLAFSLPPPDLSSGPADPDHLRVGVGVYNYCSRGEGNEAAAKEYAGYLDTLCSFIKWLTDRGHSVRLLAGDLAYDDDVRADVLKALTARGFDVSGPQFTNEPIGSYQELFTQLAQIDTLVATRFHNLVLTLFLGKTCVSLSHETKNLAVMTSVGLGKYCQELERLNRETILEHFRDLLAHRLELEPQIAATAARNRAQLQQQYADVIRLLN